MSLLGSILGGLSRSGRSYGSGGWNRGRTSYGRRPLGFGYGRGRASSGGWPMPVRQYMTLCLSHPRKGRCRSSEAGSRCGGGFWPTSRASLTAR